MDIKEVADIKLNFILATGRTGSTLLSSMLNMHPNVISPTEEPFVYYLYPKYKDVKNWTSKIIHGYCEDFYLFSKGKLEKQFSSKKDLKTALENYTSELNFDIVIRLTYLCFYPYKDKSEIKIVADKQLEFHANLEIIAKIYPQSKFIILHRDPRDQILSRYKLSKPRHENEKPYLFWAYVWKHKYSTLLKKAAKIGGNRFLEVKYEDLILDPEKELGKICTFLNITYTDIMLQYDDHYKKLGRELNVTDKEKQEFLAIHSGLIQKVNSKKIGIWKQELKNNDINVIWTICGNLAEKIGYTRPENFIKQPMRIREFGLISTFLLSNKILPKIYHPLPFFLKRLIKKIR